MEKELQNDQNDFSMETDIQYNPFFSLFNEIAF